MSRRQPASVSTLQILAGAVVLLGVLVGLAFFLAPRKPDAPPRSEVSYQPPPIKSSDEPLPDNEPLPPPTQSRAPGDTENAVVQEGEAGGEGEEMPYAIDGTVLSGDEGGKPLAGVEIQAVLTNPPVPASPEEGDSPHELGAVKTDLEGHYVVALAKPGIYQLTFSRNGYLTTQQTADPLDLDQKTVTLDATLYTGAKVSGRVTVLGTSEPAEGVTVVVDGDAIPQPLPGPRRFARTRPAGGAGTSQHAQTDADGRYELSGLAPGEYGVTLVLRGTAYVPGKALPFQKVKITQPTEKKENVDFTVEVAGIVWGYVMDPAKTPVPEVDVVLCTSDSILSQALNSAARQAPPISGRSDAEGYYELKGVPLNQPWRLYATSGKNAPQLADPFIITPTERSVRIDVYLFGGSNVYGTVVNKKGEAVPDAQIMCIPAYTKLLSPMESPQAFKNGRSDENGAFVLEQLPPGDYQVFAQKRGYKMSVTGYPIYPDGYTNITGVNLELSSAEEGDHAVFGTVIDNTGMGVDGAEVKLTGVGSMGLDAMDRSVSTAGGGQFRFDGVSPGYYTMEVRMAGYSPVTVRRVRLDEPIQVKISQSATVRGVVIARDTGKAPLSFTMDAYPLSEANGRPNIMGMMGGPSNSMTFSAPDGSFELHLDAGAYRLEATADGYTPARLEVTVETGQVMEGVTLYLENDGGIIAGTVAAGDGGNVQGASVTLVEAATPAEAMLMLPAAMEKGDHTKQVGNDGAFRFEDLPAGNYFVVAQHPRYANAQSEPIFLAAREKRENIRIRFGFGGGVEGTVFRAGQPVPGAVILLAGGGSTKNATTDQSGYYKIDGLAAGTYQAMVTEVNSGSLDSIYGARGMQVVIEEGKTTRCDFGSQTGATIEGQCFPGPANMLGGRAVLQMPGANPTPLGAMADLNQLMGQSTGINPMGKFTMEDVPPGEWQLDIYYFELGGPNPLQVRYVHTELVTVAAAEMIPLILNVQY